MIEPFLQSYLKVDGRQLMVDSRERISNKACPALAGEEGISNKEQGMMKLFRSHTHHSFFTLLTLIFNCQFSSTSVQKENSGIKRPRRGPSSVDCGLRSDDHGQMTVGT